MDKHFFTIIIAIRNVAPDLATTLDMLDAQSLQDFEVIIADCNSTDAPETCLKGRPYPIRHIVQDDSGIYDGWNKVLPLAQGQWINFMGAGDQFASDRTLAQVRERLSALPPEVLIAYGQIDALGENGQVLHTTGAPWPKQLQEIAGFDMYPHQATFQRRSSLIEHGAFDASLRIAGDIDMALRLSHVREPTFLAMKVANFQFGGVSNRPQSRKQVIAEHCKVLMRHGIRPKNRLLTLSKAYMVTALNRLLPKPVLHGIIDLYRRLTGRRPRFR